MKLSELLENPKLMNQYRSELIPTKFEDLPKSLQEKVKSFDEWKNKVDFMKI